MGVIVNKENNQNDLLNNTINTLRNDKSVFEVDDIQTSLTSAFENTNSTSHPSLSISSR